MRKINKYFFIIILSIAASNPNSYGQNKWMYPTTFSLGSKVNDTTYQLLNDSSRFFKIKTALHVKEFYISGNLLGEGQVKEKDCFIYQEVNGEEEKRCNYVLDGEWKIYYDSNLKVPRAVIHYSENEQDSSIHFDIKGNVIERQIRKRNGYFKEYYDTNRIIIKTNEFAYTLNDEILLKEVTYHKGEPIRVNQKPFLIRFYYNYLIEYYITLSVLFFIKIISGLILYSKYYKSLNLFSDRVFLKAFVINISSVFFFWIKNFNKSYSVLIHIYNTVSVLILFLFFSMIFSFFIDFL